MISGIFQQAFNGHYVPQNLTNFGVLVSAWAVSMELDKVAWVGEVVVVVDVVVVVVAVVVGKPVGVVVVVVVTVGAVVFALGVVGASVVVVRKGPVSIRIST